MLVKLCGYIGIENQDTKLSNFQQAPRKFYPYHNLNVGFNHFTQKARSRQRIATNLWSLWLHGIIIITTNLSSKQFQILLAIFQKFAMVKTFANFPSWKSGFTQFHWSTILEDQLILIIIIIKNYKIEHFKNFS